MTMKLVLPDHPTEGVEEDTGHSLDEATLHQRYSDYTDEEQDRSPSNGEADDMEMDSDPQEEEADDDV